MSLQDPAEREYLACIVEELRYGEARGQELVAACRSNPALLAWDEALAVQALDEERHRAQLVALAATLPPPPPVPAPWRVVLDGAAQLAGTAAGVAVVHGVLESFVLADLKVVQSFWPDDRGVAQVFGAIARDEARHVAFGDRWLRRCGPLAGAADADRRVTEWLAALADGYADSGGIEGLSRARAREFEERTAAAHGLASRRVAARLEQAGLSRAAAKVRALEAQ